MKGRTFEKAVCTRGQILPYSLLFCFTEACRCTLLCGRWINTLGAFDVLLGLGDGKNWKQQSRMPSLADRESSSVKLGTV